MTRTSRHGTRGSTGGHHESVDVVELEAALREAVDGEVRFDAGSRGAYATDGSNYRQVPLGVVVPHSVDAAVRAVEVCRRFRAPVLSRGGGTSLAGQGTNTAVVVDWTKYCHALVSVDPDARTCVVEPGIVLDELNRRLADHRLQFGPKPSTHSHCALGGMIGNNSCGASAQAYGKTVDNVRRLEILTYDGTRMWVGPTDEAERGRIAAEGGRRAEIHAGLERIVAEYLADIRQGYPRIPRRVSGYNMDSLLPENGFDLAKALVGSEGTLVTVLRAELDLVPVPACQALLVLGYDDICSAADDVPELLRHCSPGQLEALDGRMAQLMREEGAYLDSLDALPDGDSWLMLQFVGDSQDDVDEQAHALLRALGRGEKEATVAFSDDPEREQKMLRAREAGLGVTARPPDDRETWEGWEDSAVPPERLGDYLRDLKDLFEEFDYDHPSLYGHFGQGCVHTRIPFGLKTAEGVADFRRFLERAADLVASYGGSLSGEHGDGQSRGELLTRMFGERLVTAFGEVKALFDPDNLMNPGKVVDPNPVDGQLRLGPAWRPAGSDTHFGYPDDENSFTRAVMRCVGIGNCRSHQGGVMCPSYRARRRRSTPPAGGPGCCSRCSTATPTRRSPTAGARRRSATPSTCAWPARAASRTARRESTWRHTRPSSSHTTTTAGCVPRRTTPWAGCRCGPGCPAWPRRWPTACCKRQVWPARANGWPAWTTPAGRRCSHRDADEPDPADPRTVVLWPDTFSTYFHPSIAISAVRVLEDAGFRVAVPTDAVCCGLTWISTGQLTVAKKVLRRTLDILRPYIEAGTPVIGLEPSCTAVFRADAPELMPQDQDVRRLAGQFRTFAEHLVRHAPKDWQPPAVTRQAVVQTHCHQHAIMKDDPDRELMRRAHLDADVLDEGCCGLAGNFGFERGHHEISMAVAEQGVLPAVRAAAPDSLLLADGFSCRTQIEQGDTGRRALHLAEVLALGLEGNLPGQHPERLARRPSEPSRAARWAITAGAATLTAGAAAVAGRAATRRLRGHP
jgi:FAD/FMN-containing dehydrogenase/Fe-S oxidoreductase